MLAAISVARVPAPLCVPAIILWKASRSAVHSQDKCRGATSSAPSCDRQPFYRALTSARVPREAVGPGWLYGTTLMAPDALSWSIILWSGEYFRRVGADASTL